MAKIESSDLHKTPGGKSGFFRQLQAATQCARQLIAELKGSKKKDMIASGAIHGLALLAKEAPRRSLPVSDAEVDDWQETFFSWFSSAKRYFPAPIRDEFSKKAELDFKTIREKTNPLYRPGWQQQRDSYERPVPFRNREIFDLACQRAKERYPVDLGIALDEYIRACVQRLLNEDDHDKPLVVEVQQKQPEDKPGTVAPRLVTFDDGTHSLIVTSFGGLQRPARSGLGLQKAVRQFLQTHSKHSLDNLEFDSESSMFSARSDCLKSLAAVSEAIYTIAANAKTENAS